MRVTTIATLDHRPTSSRRAFFLMLIAIAVSLIALLDRATGDAPFQHLYYIPIIFGAIEFGFVGGLVVSFVSVLLYHFANPGLMLRIHEFRQADIVQVILFFVVGLVAAKLANDAKRLRLLSITDDLTGLHNLRSFESHLATFVSRAKKDGSMLSVLVLDVDRLKSLNDRYGHLTGADAVRTVGRLIAQHTPPQAVACRFGGDEFVIAIPNCRMAQAVDIAEQLRVSVSQEQPVLAARSFPSGTLSISIGAASRRVEKDAEPLAIGEELFCAADQALYRAKEMGRNGVSASQ
jgi:diguanylate cyclase (GGDEF)-like protein